MNGPRTIYQLRLTEVLAWTTGARLIFRLAAKPGASDAPCRPRRKPLLSKLPCNPTPHWPQRSRKRRTL